MDLNIIYNTLGIIGVIQIIGTYLLSYYKHPLFTSSKVFLIGNISGIFWIIFSLALSEFNSSFVVFESSFVVASIYSLYDFQLKNRNK